MSSKGDCGIHGSCKRRKLYWRVFACVLAIIILILLIILIIWLVLRPTKPRFYLQDVTVQQFNLSSPNLLSSSIQITISSRNPNDNVGIYYDRLDSFIFYKNQQITLATSLPTGYQGHNDITMWSPYLEGSMVPIAPYLCDAIQQDESAGLLLLYIKIDGRLRWKVGSWISGHYHIYVNCPALLTFGNGKANGYSPSLKFNQISTCSVDV
ncbi:NDR1/HIN1-like protein 1 [Dioscorea cayenensis subsp. rotundata]|uniref:NDR1/HIN1-like protein 1 n=1 Tax=Dioscorea cayennensis subsp. rotundata TaxID=55577 RepID=A0AB40B9P4_DIOCR|nr:NDR1/HIN1-like protein 1 [Dioscorea cayenensis subsp. rotundata]